jgi:hypothetical protein
VLEGRVLKREGGSLPVFSRLHDTSERMLIFSPWHYLVKISGLIRQSRFQCEKDTLTTDYFIEISP